MPAVMNKSNVISIQIFPRPIKTGELTKRCIFVAYIVTCVILNITEVQWIAIFILFTFRANMKRKIALI